MAAESAEPAEPADSLQQALDVVRRHVLDADQLVRAVASGRRRGRAKPRSRRVELRWVDLKAGRQLQVTAYDETQAHTTNHPDPGPVLEELLAEPFGNWHVETSAETHQLRVTKKGEGLLHSRQRLSPVEATRAHDRAKDRLLDPEHPVLRELGLTDDQGRVKPSRQAKLRQVERLLRELAAALADARDRGALREPTADDPWRVVDLGCGNAYLTFAAQAFLADRFPVRLVGVDVKEQSRRDSTARAERLGIADRVEFVAGDIAGVRLDPAPEVVLALHACDTATDEALARTLEWQSPLVLAAPCCHRDLSAQLRASTPPPEYAALVRDGILRERFADTLTDALRASVMRQHGYRVDVVEFVESQHTPRNTLLRAVRTTAADGDPAGDPEEQQRYDRLVGQWQLRPALVELVDGPRSPG